jgi:putative phosphoesterase
MTVIGLVSDTHLPRFGRALPRALERGLRDAEVSRILHMGDFTEPLAADLFAAIAPFDAVAGNNDGEEISQRFGRKKILTIEDVRVGMIHGDAGRGSALSNAVAAFAGEPVDVICFGHSHHALVERKDNVLLVNPGSPTDKRTNPRYSYGIMRIHAGHIDVDLKYYIDRQTA